MTEAAERTPLDSHALMGLWAGSATPIGDAQAKALAFGVNFRIDVMAAFRAVAETVHAFGAAARAIASHGGDVEAALTAGTSGIAAARSTVAALAEGLGGFKYVGCIVLADHPGGLTQDEFEFYVRQFLAEAEGLRLPWYLGVDADRLETARAELDRPDAGIAALVASLEEDGLATWQDGRLAYRQVNLRWGINRD